MPKKVKDAQSRKVVKLPIPETSPEPATTKSIEQEVFEILSTAKPLKKACGFQRVRFSSLLCRAASFLIAQQRTKGVVRSDQPGKIIKVYKYLV